MPRRRKGFIDKNNSVTFRLVYRSQQDPLIADEQAPGHVLLPVEEKLQKNKRKEDVLEQKKQQRNYGIFFDDDYNYLQHLKGVNVVNIEWEPVERPRQQKAVKERTLETRQMKEAKLQLPSSLFESEYEEKVGLLNKAAPVSGPRPELDPDIVAAMDDDFDFSNPDNILEDNFIQLANGVPEGIDVDVDSGDSADAASDVTEDDDLGSLTGPQFTYCSEETRSRFTNYSLSSSVIRRNEQLSLLDDKFDKMFEEYDDSEIGALDCEEIEGYVRSGSDLLKMYASEFEKERVKDWQKDIAAKEKIIKEEEEEEIDVELLEDVVVEEHEKWDCESFLSTYSNIYNHPKLIQAPPPIKVSQKSGIPVDVITKPGLTRSNLARLEQETATNDNDVMSVLSSLSIRSKNETPAEKAARKRALKGYRRERRLEKKANTLAFKEEKKRQEQIIVNSHKNVQGIKLL